MPFCTIVEFEFDQTFDRQAFADMIAAAGDGQSPAGRLSKIVGIDDGGGRVIEVWRSGADARAYAEQSAPFLATVPMPPPSRVLGFEVTEYERAAEA